MIRWFKVGHSWWFRLWLKFFPIAIHRTRPENSKYSLCLKNFHIATYGLTFLTTSMPSTMVPNTTCFPSSQDVLAVQIKNCDPLVLGPALAMLRMPLEIQNVIKINTESVIFSPGPVCLRVKFSSWNFSPYIDFPPVPLKFVKSPPWHIKFGMTRWKMEPLKPKPFSPVHKALKFSAVFGTTSLRS